MSEPISRTRSDFAEVILTGLEIKYSNEVFGNCIVKRLKRCKPGRGVKYALVFRELDGITKDSPTDDKSEIKYAFHVGALIDGIVHHIKGSLDYPFNDMKTEDIDTFYDQPGLHAHIEIIPNDPRSFKTAVRKRSSALHNHNYEGSTLGRNYDFFDNNCEHFSTYILFGRSMSKQIDIATTGVMVVGGIALKGVVKTLDLVMSNPEVFGWIGVAAFLSYMFTR